MKKFERRQMFDIAEKSDDIRRFEEDLQQIKAQIEFVNKKTEESNLFNFRVRKS
jgi:hypothetical protein